jgi:hypothetical protein
MHNHSKWGFCGEMFVFPQGNDDVTSGICVCFPKEMFVFPRGDVLVSLRKMKLYTLFLRKCIYGTPSLRLTLTLGYFLGTSTNGFLSSFCHYDLKMCYFIAKWFRDDQLRRRGCGGLSSIGHMVYFCESPR